MDIQKDRMERPEARKNGTTPEHTLDDPITLWTQNCLERDTEYKNLLSHYVSQQKQTDKAQFWFRMVFFIIICAVFLFVIVFGMLGILNITKKELITWTDIGAAFAGLGSILSVIIILPSKIAEHLFPASGIKNSFDFIATMQSYDMSQNGSWINTEVTINRPSESEDDTEAKSAEI